MTIKATAVSAGTAASLGMRNFLNFEKYPLAGLVSGDNVKRLFERVD